MWGHLTHFLEFWDPIISWARTTRKLQNSNSAERWMVESTNEKMQNYLKMGHVGAYFWNFGTPNISGTNKARNFKFGIEYWRKN